MRYFFLVLELIGVAIRTVAAFGLLAVAFVAASWQIMAFNDEVYNDFVANVVENAGASHAMGLVLFCLPGILAFQCGVASYIIIRSIERGWRQTPRL